MCPSWTLVDDVALCMCLHIHICCAHTHTNHTRQWINGTTVSRSARINNQPMHTTISADMAGKLTCRGGVCSDYLHSIASNSKLRVSRSYFSRTPMDLPVVSGSPESATPAKIATPAMVMASVGVLACATQKGARNPPILATALAAE